MLRVFVIFAAKKKLFSFFNLKKNKILLRLDVILVLDCLLLCGKN